MNFKPLGDCVVIEEVKGTEETKSGILIPEVAREKPQEGVVVSVGIGRQDERGCMIPMLLKEGDRILFGKYSGTMLKIEEKDYVIMHQDDILGVLL